MGYALEQLLEENGMEPQKICTLCNKRPAPTERSRFCEDCAQARRTWQLVINNQRWRAKIKEGKAAHRIRYNGAVTQWAKENPTKAIRMAIEEGYTDEQLKQLLSELE